ncbi:hypothetical protein HanRHA438_Chr04g0151041 [Helianthus annuus]|uniref:Uncharacterized protein n=1 Tax=Helianthus annuus TaxID=4232 RepID=A0A9K3J4T0_HELAN|nr:hypothetical protein HanXRQr2_Chr04g0139561 [Helianthus annuus]KAJ0579231.1 hypothetical protein HanHA300_Chr04g0115711 [Helianthus annuus]KAJ0595125.1 hypothetical protein HanHA89_Chr04g0127881 [Helianthus annuus]KAJ0759589.1 hypothetical protein HanOQP8_Chr04g0128401 [Helianthus annuus]KAJ0924666.1 hypothetical protein HanRHA438_Chr04g0151041 [Helianthus annuus]
MQQKKGFQLSDPSPPSDYIPTIGFYRQPDKRRFSTLSIFVTPTHLFHVAGPCRRSRVVAGKT